MSDILSTGVSGLLAFQRALDTTSHNIANVGTEGYSRQSTGFVARQPEAYGSGWLGTGVDVATVRRVYDDVLGLQVRNSSSGLAQLDTFATNAESVSNLFSDSTTGLSASLQNFANALQGVANTPTSVPARQVLLSQAQALTDRLKSYDSRLNELDSQINSRLTSEVSAINSDADSIAKLNSQIAAGLSQTGQPPNDLLDKRDTLLKDLSTHVGVNVVNQSDGTLSVFIGTGQPLVLGATAATLTTVRDTYNTDQLKVAFTNPAGSVDVTSNLTGGTVGGLLQFRAQMLDPARNQLGQLATTVVQTINEQHRSGIDLNGAAGGDLFALGGVRVSPDVGNSNGASVAVTRADASAITAHDYTLEFNSGAWSLRREDNGASVALGGTGTALDPFTADGLSIVVTGTPVNGDRYLVEPTSGAISGLSVLITDPNAVAAASPIRTGAGTGNTGTGAISSGTVTDPANPALQTATTIQFLSPTTYSVNGSGTFTYTPGAAINLNGWSVALTGAPAVGDQFTVSSNVGGTGDNRNALALANSLGNANAAIGTFVGSIGVQTSQAQSGRDAQQSINDDDVAALDSVSGVNLDEEAANMLRFQQAYQAAAQIIRVTDTMFQSLLDATRR